ncbi:MAG TPA: methylenetetrahydrofolate reductase [NAD(P)H] [Gammaproteobacteria bacterium]|nr:methylenetetrahydrofolate reductase [NAD(P)H] [Gammaproteobacteria bacterium]
MESQRKHPQTFSFELFPPRTEKGIESLRGHRDQLAKLNPKFFSVTFGAGGSTQERTLDTVLEIQQASGIDAAPHLSCVGSSRERISSILNTYKDAGIRHIVALRGDLPSGVREPGEFRYANELVSYIREETGDHFYIEVAAYPETHPQAGNAVKDLENFKNKMNAGANTAITQYFFNPDSYFAFIDSCEKMGIDAPIVPGIMPINNYIQLARFSDACGAEIPRWIRQRLESYGDDLDSIKHFGVEVITKMCDRLLSEGAPGLHFYTMNKAEPTVTIWNNLGLSENN